MGRKSSRLVEGHRLCEHVTLGVLARVVPVCLVDAALRDTGRWKWRASTAAMPRRLLRDGSSTP